MLMDQGSGSRFSEIGFLKSTSSVLLVSINRYMLGFITRSFRVVLLCWALLNTGVLIMVLQLFAWFQMSKDLSRELPLVQAMKLVVSGKEACEICQFCNEKNPANDKSSNEKIVFEPPFLYLASLSAGFVNSVPESSLPSVPQYSIISSFELGIDPPPPKLA